MKETIERVEVPYVVDVLQLGFVQLQDDPTIAKLRKTRTGYLGGGMKVWMKAGELEGIPKEEILPAVYELLDANTLTVGQAHLEISSRKVVDEMLRATPDIFAPNKNTYTFSHSPYKEQTTDTGCHAACLSAICQAIGIDVSEQDILDTGKPTGFVKSNGSFSPFGINVLLTPSITDYLRDIRQDIEGLEVIFSKGCTVKEVTSILSEFQEGGDDVYFIATLSSEIEPLDYHNVVVESIGPEIVRIHDPSNRIGGDKTLPTPIFIRRFAQGSGQGNFVRVIKKQS